MYIILILIFWCLFSFFLLYNYAFWKKIFVYINIIVLKVKIVKILDVKYIFLYIKKGTICFVKHSKPWEIWSSWHLVYRKIFGYIVSELWKKKGCGTLVYNTVSIIQYYCPASARHILYNNTVPFHFNFIEDLIIINYIWTFYYCNDIQIK